MCMSIHARKKFDQLSKTEKSNNKKPAICLLVAVILVIFPVLSR